MLDATPAGTRPLDPAELLRTTGGARVPIAPGGPMICPFPLGPVLFEPLARSSRPRSRR